MMQISSWLTMFRRGIAGQLDALGQQLAAQGAVLQQLLQGQAKLMSSLDDLTKAVDDAAAEMAHAAQTITSHPNPDIANDPRLTALATRLNDASTALKAVDPVEAVAQAAGSGDTDTTTAQPSA